MAQAYDVIDLEKIWIAFHMTVNDRRPVGALIQCTGA